MENQKDRAWDGSYGGMMRGWVHRVVLNTNGPNKQCYID